jgi:hypothetical protein
MKADVYIVPRLLKDHTNPYAVFFERFNKSHFLTFNYDSLPEIFLYRRKVWYPQDGYGVPVHVELDALAKEDPRHLQSSRYVLHLHGSLCIYASSYDLTGQPGGAIQWLARKGRPDYIFDPDAITCLFSPYRRTLPVLGYELPEHRVIAPVPDKAEGLQGEFVSEVHLRAAEILASARQVIAIGYRFNALDRNSYDQLLTALSRAPSPEAVLVSPDAESLKDRLSRDYPKIGWKPQARTFESWVEAGFPGAIPS